MAWGPQSRKPGQGATPLISRPGVWGSRARHKLQDRQGWPGGTSLSLALLCDRSLPRVLASPLSHRRADLSRARLLARVSTCPPPHPVPTQHHTGVFALLGENYGLCFFI